MTTAPTIHPAGTATITIEIEIAAPRSTTWTSMIEEIGDWWRADFLVCQDSLGMALEPRAGGLLHEKGPGPDTGFVWGQVIRFEPEEHFAFLAQIVPPWGGPAQSVVQIALHSVEGDPSKTRLTLSDSLIGNLTEELLSNADDGWRMLFGEGGLKTHAESR